MGEEDFDIVYAVTGEKASGKGEFGKRLADQGVAHMTLSAPMRVIAEREVGPRNESADLVRIGNLGRALHGTGYWASETLKLANQQGCRLVSVDGIRNLGEIEMLRKLVGRRLVLAGFVAPTILRFERMRARGRKGDPETLEEFLEMDDVDRGIGQPSDGQQVGRCLAAVPPENVYNNIGTLEECRRWADGFHFRSLTRVNAACSRGSDDDDFGGWSD